MNDELQLFTCFVTNVFVSSSSGIKKLHGLNVAPRSNFARTWSKKQACVLIWKLFIVYWCVCASE